MRINNHDKLINNIFLLNNNLILWCFDFILFRSIIQKWTKAVQFAKKSISSTCSHKFINAFFLKFSITMKICARIFPMVSEISPYKFHLQILSLLCHTSFHWISLIPVYKLLLLNSKIFCIYQIWTFKLIWKILLHKKLAKED